MRQTICVYGKNAQGKDCLEKFWKNDPDRFKNNSVYPSFCPGSLFFTAYSARAKIFDS
jgi:hypothetical protein